MIDFRSGHRHPDGQHFKVFIVDLGDNEEPPPDIPPDYSSCLIGDTDTPESLRIRKLLHIGPYPEGGIRGVASCDRCDYSAVLWFGSHTAVRERSSINLGELTRAEVDELRGYLPSTKALP